MSTTPTNNAAIAKAVALDVSDWQAAASTLNQHDDDDRELFDYLSKALAGQAPFYLANELAPFYFQITTDPVQGAGHEEEVWNG